MHDATEGGILGALAEMADASRHAFFLEKSSVNVAPETLAVCSAFKIDPLATVSEGALILTVSPESADQVQMKLHRSGIAARQIGTVKPGRGLWVASSNGDARKMKPPVDRFWSAYRRGIRSHLK
jgi:hydrogenase maturation factor